MVKGRSGIYVESIEQAVDQLNKWIVSGDSVLIKGSRGTAMERIFEFLLRIIMLYFLSQFEYVISELDYFNILLSEHWEQLPRDFLMWLITPELDK